MPKPEIGSKNLEAGNPGLQKIAEALFSFGSGAPNIEVTEEHDCRLVIQRKFIITQTEAIAPVMGRAKGLDSRCVDPGSGIQPSSGS